MASIDQRLNRLEDLIKVLFTRVGAGGAGTITGSGTTNKVPKFTSATAIGDSIIYDDGSKIGIGTTSPSQVLDVAGNIKTSGTVLFDAGVLGLRDKGGNTVAFDGGSAYPTAYSFATNSVQTGALNIALDGSISVSGTVDGRDLATDGSKLDGIEAGATKYPDTGEQAFLDADHSKLDGIEAGADVTDATNVAAAGAVMESDTTTAAMSFVIDEDNMASNLATKVPTQQSVKAYADTKSSPWTTIGTTELTEPAATMEIGSIAAGYIEFKVFWKAIHETAGTGTTMVMRLNSDTGNNYSDQLLQGYGSTASAAQGAGASYIRMVNISGRRPSGGTIEITQNNYAAERKLCWGHGGSADPDAAADNDTPWYGAFCGVWQNATNEITTITLLPAAGGNLNTGSYMVVMGRK